MEGFHEELLMTINGRSSSRNLSDMTRDERDNLHATQMQTSTPEKRQFIRATHDTGFPSSDRSSTSTSLDTGFPEERRPDVPPNRENKDETSTSSSKHSPRRDDKSSNPENDSKEPAKKTEHEEGKYEELICLVRQFYVEKPLNPAALAYQNIETC